MPPTTLDGKIGGHIAAELSHGIQYQPSWSGLAQLDTNYEIKIKNDQGEEHIYNVTGNGLLTLDSATNSIIWNLDTGALKKTRYTGYIKSDSNQAGIAYFNSIELHIIERG